MRFEAAFLAAVVLATAPLSGPTAAASPEPHATECGSGRAWWPPIEACVTLPVLKKKVEPSYPGTVAGLRYGAILFVKVSAKGAVGDVQVLKALPTDDLSKEGEAALSALVDAVRQWRFAPGLGPDGKPVAMSVTLKVHLITG
jgi:outer membrane biosynthesis protein TonB